MLHPFSFYGDIAGLHGLDALLSELQGAENIEVLSVGQCAAKYGQRQVADTWLGEHCDIYPLTEEIARWAKSGPLACFLLGVGPPLLLSLSLAALARALGRGRILRSRGNSMLWVYTAMSVLVFTALVASGYGLYHKYDSFSFKGQLFVVVLLVFGLDTARRVWALRTKGPTASTTDGQ